MGVGELAAAMEANLLTNYVTSLIRTWVPIGIGTVLAWLSTKIGFVIDEQSQVQAVAGATGFLIALYYAVVRWAETKYPQLGWLLGMAKSPGYEPGPPPQEPPGANEEI